MESSTELPEAALLGEGKRAAYRRLSPSLTKGMLSLNPFRKRMAVKIIQPFQHARAALSPLRDTRVPPKIVSTVNRLRYVLVQEAW